MSSCNSLKLTADCNPSKFVIRFPSACKDVSLSISSLVISSSLKLSAFLIAAFKRLSGIITISTKSITHSHLNLISYFCPRLLNADKTKSSCQIFIPSVNIRQLD
ncbi:hypothetical protein lbkm_2132 [Lachnospiraceae bacterium KM106-2]|nr:hypothetical protein lbkm_2132 [Lachnospiraceae bacterium KM106-2]